MISSPWWSETFAFFKKAHKDQKYHDNLPYWHHLYCVALMLEKTIDECKEMDEHTKRVVVLAALGHDSLEDTDVTKEELKERFGAQVLEFIEGMTNEEGDKKTQKYVDRMLTAKEEVRLIKMSDSIDNYMRMAHRAKDNGAIWYAEKIVPIMENMYQRILDTKFTKYPKTAEELKRLLRLAHALGFTALYFQGNEERK